MRTTHGSLFRALPILVMLTLAILLVACKDEATGATDRSSIPIPVSGVIRQDCDTIANSDYFLSTEEEDWFSQNCDRADCALIRGTEYRSSSERAWYLANCR